MGEINYAFQHSKWGSLVILTFAGIIVFSINGCEQSSVEESNSKLFQLLSSDETGIDFSNQLNENVHTNENVLSFQYFYNGGGVAAGDVNNDGLQDVFFTGNQVPNKLYLNKGDLKFEDITEKAGLSGNNWSSGVSMADVNDDGFLDIYICQAGPSNNSKERENLLYVNQGDGTFKEMAKAFGINDGNRSIQASFFDYDKDGDLDLYVMNESNYFFVPLNKVFQDLKNPQKLREASGKLFQNQGNGKFKDVTEQAGMLKYGYGLGLVTTDINNDGWVDVYVANDFSVPDFLYINNGDGTFTDAQNTTTKQISWFGMGADIADFNNDGYMDIGVVDMAAADHIRSKTLMASMSTDNFWTYVNYLGYQYQYMFNSLQLNQGPVPGEKEKMIFSNVANLTGTAKTDWSWAALFADFDNDGNKDYFISNGYKKYSLDNDFQIKLREIKQQYGGVPDEMREELYNEMPSVKLPNIFYHNNGELKFDEKAKDFGLDQPSFSNGAAYADLDNDGDLDLLINNIDEEAFIYKNNSEKKGNHYLQVKFKEGARNASNLNARVTLHYGDDIQVLENTPVRGYQSAMGEKLHFGLGKTKAVDQLIVEWKDGKKLVVDNPGLDRVITVSKADAKITDPENGEDSDYLFVKKNAGGFGIDFKHTENNFDDFKREILLPHKQSTLGPFISSADVNGDQLEDFFIGGALGQSGVMYLQQTDGNFKKSVSQPWRNDRQSEDLGSLFFDADGDNDLDLYVVSGGNEYPIGDKRYQDRLYLNDGKGNFRKDPYKLPNIYISGKAVSAHDFDQDGDLDLFVGGRSIPGKYPHAPKTYVLMNEGAGDFIDVTDEVAPEFKDVGLVNDMLWDDIDSDGDQDLIMVGEWMPITVFENDNGRLSNVTDYYGFNDYKGWWYSLESVDVDNDGDMDFVAGNIGGNNKFHPSTEKPLHIYSSDFDGNGSYDVVLSKDYKGELVPVRGRECSSQQMPFIAEKFPSYQEFAEANLEDIYTPEKLSRALHREVNDFYSYVFLKEDDGSYTAKKLPAMAQIAPINGMVTEDFNGDGNIDLLLAGNMFNAEVETPRYDAGNGLLLLGDGRGEFKSLKPEESGFYTPGNIKDLQMVKSGSDEKFYLLTATNNGLVDVHVWRSQMRERFLSKK